MLTSDVMSIIRVPESGNPIVESTSKVFAPETIEVTNCVCGWIENSPTTEPFWLKL